jgi:hypothetical protein
MTVTLSELTKLIHGKSLEEMLSVSEQYNDFTNTINSVGSELLQDVDSTELLTAVTLMQSHITASLVEDGNLSISSLRFLMSQDFAEIVAVIFRMSVGLAAVEELR